MRPVPVILRAVTVGFALVGWSTADDWPQWRGPDRQNLSRESLLSEWPERGPRRVWLFRDCGVGYSGPSISGDQLFIMGARNNVEQLICVDVTTGRELWATAVGDMLENGWGDGPRSTPTVDGGKVFALSGQGSLLCARIRDGAEVWKTQMQEFGGSIPNWGYSESVLVDGDQLVCTPGGVQGAMLALNKSTGEKIWQSTEFTDSAQYASPIVAVHNDVRQYIQITQHSVVSIRADNGHVLWRAEWPGRVAVVPTPIFHDGHVYVTSGYGVGCNLFKVDKDNNVAPQYDADTRKVMKNQHGGVLLFEGHVYGYSDGGGWVCQDFRDGTVVWRERSRLGKGAICGGGGMLFCISEDEGHVVLATASPRWLGRTGSIHAQPTNRLAKAAWTHLDPPGRVGWKTVSARPRSALLFRHRQPLSPASGEYREGNHASRRWWKRDPTLRVGRIPTLSGREWSSGGRRGAGPGLLKLGSSSRGKRVGRSSGGSLVPWGRVQ